MTETELLIRFGLALLGGGVVLLAGFSLLPATAPGARALWPLMATEVVIVAAALILVVPGGLWTTVGLALLAGRCGYEAARVALCDAERLPLVVAALAGLAAALAHAAGPVGAVAGLGLVAIAGALANRRAPKERPTEGWVLLVFPLLPLAGFAFVAGRDGGAATLLLAFVLVETMDSFAVLGGRLFGRHPAFPRLSPRKTIEGLATGLLGVTVVGLALGVGLLGRSIGPVLVSTMLAAVTTVAGDLAASAIKRRAGVKDYPPIHALQGGVLDIVDAWIVTGTVLGLVAALA